MASEKITIPVNAIKAYGWMKVMAPFICSLGIDRNE
jgi:hypothetical protein